MVIFRASVILEWLDGCSFQEFEESSDEYNLECIQDATGGGSWLDSKDVEDMAKEFPSQTLITIKYWVDYCRKEYDSPEAKKEREEEERQFQAMWRSEIAREAGCMYGMQAYYDHMDYDYNC